MKTKYSVLLPSENIKHLFCTSSKRRENAEPYCIETAPVLLQMLALSFWKSLLAPSDAYTLGSVTGSFIMNNLRESLQCN